MHLVNDYLHFELKHSNSQPPHAVNIVTLVLLTVSDIDFIQLHLKCKKNLLLTDHHSPLDLCATCFTQ